jgi:hypothetical protein
VSPVHQRIATPSKYQPGGGDTGAGIPFDSVTSLPPSIAARSEILRE